MNIKAVIFDLDGLIADTEIISYKIYQDIIAHYGYEMSLKTYTEEYSGKTEVKNVTQLIESYHLPISVDEGIRQVNELEDQYLRKVAFKKGALELLQHLKKQNISISLATSSTKDRALLILDKYDASRYFDYMTFGNEVEKGKPNPDIFLKAYDKLDVEKEDCLILEDSEAGVQAGLASNIPVICVPDLKRPADIYLSKCLNVVDSLLDIISLHD